MCLTAADRVAVMMGKKQIGRRPGGTSEGNEKSVVNNTSCFNYSRNQEAAQDQTDFFQESLLAVALRFRQRLSRLKTGPENA